MKTVKRIVVLLLVHMLLLTLASCGDPAQPGETTEAVETAPTAPDPVLQERRDAAESYMREMANFMWRATEDVYYTRDNEVLTEEDLAAYNSSKVLKIRAGRLYRGIPYSYAGTSAHNFYDFASEPDENGVATVSGLPWRGLNGSTASGAVLGNDCSAAVQLAWNYIGAELTLASTEYMVKDNGFLPVGDYVSDPSKNILTKDVCKRNTAAVMFDSYALLQNADALVARWASAGHAMMVVGNNPVYKADGTVDGMQSYVTVVHQTSEYMFKEKLQFEADYGEAVYKTFGIDDKFTYMELFGEGYLPLTCAAFIDPTPVEETYTTDSETTATFENILQGTFSSNRIISAVTITITDEDGNVVTEAVVYCPRQSGKSEFVFDLNLFETREEHSRRGVLALDDLAAGNYRCVHTLRDAHGNEYVMRQFDFTV